MPHQRKKSRVPRPQAVPNTRKPVTKEELRGLEDEIKIKFDWVHEPQAHQMQGIIIAQLQTLRDALVHAGTGPGKTMIAAGPHAHRSSEGKVTLMISPLIALHDEQVETFRDEFKLKAIAVNSSNGGCKPEILQEIVKGEHQIVLISPEMALSRRFIREVLRSAEFGRRVLSIVVDEAHVVSHWGASFRKKYGTLGIIRAFLPRGTPILALSATLPARIRNDVMSKLQFGKDYANIDIGNDRPNVSLIVRAIQHPMNSYADLDFVVEGITHPSQIKKGFIYADNIATGVEIVDHVTELLPPELQKLGLIRPYNAALSKEYRREAMRQFKNGDIRILVCTDVAGMGCNIPDIDLVVQWKLPGSVSVFIQRAGPPQVPCCDICCPALFNQTRPGNLLTAPRQSAIKRGVVNKDVQGALDKWRNKILARDYPSSLYSSSMILRDESIALLSSVGPIDDLEQLKAVLAGQWLWMEEYGNALYRCLAGLQIPPMQPLPKKTRAPKHAHPAVEVPQSATVEESPATRRRLDVAAALPKPLPIAAQASSAASGSSGRGSNNPTETSRGRGRRRGRGRGKPQTPEEIKAEFARELPENPALSMLFTCGRV
ncbi:p-loop containing nucleoside triphosphate hydrolase protein [Mycena venus]|uniref:DNA 3'-5' helicase n=1 Tax=Mycena venus TaxID=2733690 RepID=A0A8H6Z3T1_9AGAR|nr:p-loop containing nucleoside triphosphate hydrolase protein [Mycena venus]